MTAFGSRAEELFARLKENGESEIRELIESRQAEDLFLDFKRSANDGNSDKLHQDDRKNIARAISGFGNGEGGIIVWGVDCRSTPGKGDVPSASVYLIENPTRFASLLTGAVSGCTVPPHTGVENHAIESSDGEGGYVVSHIPASYSAPHQVAKGTQYYMRAGSDFVPVPHGILAGMFGRRPSADLVHNWLVNPAVFSARTLTLTAGCLVRNRGHGIARSIHVTMDMISELGPNCQMEFEPIKSDGWDCSLTLGRFLCIYAKRDTLIPPGAMTTPFVLELSIAPPFDRTLKFSGQMGCEGVPPTLLSLETTAAIVAQEYEKGMSLCSSGKLPQEEAHAIATRILGTDEPQG